MNPTLTLMKREWLQHRNTWALLLIVPVLLSSLLLMFGDVDVTHEDGPVSPIVLAGAATLACVGVLMLLFLASGLINAIGLARRDHADRSVEFWLSLPIGHLRSLLVPLALHLVLVPVLAFGAALLVAAWVSLLLLLRTHGLQAWLDLPWPDVLRGAVAAFVRVGAGWPMAVLWLSPLILLATLMHAWLRRWGPVLLVIVLAIGSSPLGEVLGYRMVPQALNRVGQGALASLVSGTQSFQVRTADSSEAIHKGLQQISSWLLQDIRGSVQNLASSSFLAGLVVAALCLFALVQWRRRGASMAV